MITIFTSTITAPVMSWNMALVAVPSLGVVLIPVLRALTRPVVGLLGKAGTQRGGEISGVGSVDPAQR